MPALVNKILVTNKSQLLKKYGAGLAGTIQPAIQALIAADAARGLTTVLVALDDAPTMSALGAPRVTSPGSPKQNKAAIDAVFNHYQPDYLVILGAVDVIPHQDLINPAFTPNDPNGDPDATAPSDLPYACPGPYSRQIRNFINPTRVVGRLADVTKGSNPAVLQKALNTAAGYTSRTANTYRKYLGVTAAVWDVSTQLSLTAAFGNASAKQVVPPKTYQWTSAQLARPSHFFNCHGSDASPQYFGQPASGANSYPPAHDAAYIAGKIRRGTIAAAECCYGAELYDPALAGGQQGISNQYLQDGAYGFFGSTTIAYGPSDTNDWADVLCQDFFVQLLTGASLGRAVLQARQNYIAARSHLTTLDLKTLAQFYLLGDPAVHPVTPPASTPSPHVMTKKGASYTEPSAGAAKAVARTERRATLFQNGVALAASVGCAGEGTKTSTSIRQLLLARLKDLGAKTGTIRAFLIQPPAKPEALTKMAGAKHARSQLAKATHFVIGRLPAAKKEKTPKLVGVEVTEYAAAISEKAFRSR